MTKRDRFAWKNEDTWAQRGRRLDDVLRRSHLLTGPYTWECGYCGRSFVRIGQREGFVKSGARAHVSYCEAATLWLLGWVSLGNGRVVPREDASPYVRGLILANIAKRRRDGDLARLEARLSEFRAGDGA